MTGDGDAWLDLKPTTLQEQLAAGGVVDAMRRIKMAGLSRNYRLLVEVRNREITVTVVEAGSGHATIPATVVESM
jgi:hypothetical protein